MITFAGLTRDISDQEYLTPNNTTIERYANSGIL
jgi:hypothetical protein